MRGEQLIEAPRRRFSATTDVGLAKAIGGTNSLIAVLKQEKSVSPLRVSKPVERARVRNGNNHRRRRITTYFVPIRETAHYFSAYRVHPCFIDAVEALFARAKANNSINIRIEAQTE